MPVLDGRKTDSVGIPTRAQVTYSVEALMGDGRALQAGTSHNLGQNFAKVFDSASRVPATSRSSTPGGAWGMTTRRSSVAHFHAWSRLEGLMLPPRIAPHQAVIVAIPRGNWRDTVLPHAGKSSRACRRGREDADRRQARAGAGRGRVRSRGGARPPLRIETKDRGISHVHR